MRKIGAFSIATTLLLSSATVFAEEQRPNAMGVNKVSERNHPLASTTAARLEAARANRETEREKVKQRLSEIKDGAKQRLALQLSGQFDDLNKTWTDHFSSVLDQLESVLQKTQDRATNAAGAGKDVGSTTAAIQVAHTAITTARDAVAVQAAKSYALATTTIPTTATSTPNGQDRIIQALRTSFKALHTGLFKDLFALRDGPMKDARKAVHNALQTLTGVYRVNNSHATSTSESN
jgi:hypothetical protein